MTGQLTEARRLYEDLDKTAGDPHLRALIRNDLAALAVLAEDMETAREGFEAALALDRNCEPARTNLALLEAELAARRTVSVPAAPAVAAAPTETGSAVKVAILSFLFNWPSTGGGIIHTVELSQFLAKAGYQIRHFYVRFPPWEIGDVRVPLPFASEVLEFDQAAWNVREIQRRFRQAVDAFGPDHVIITDSWNIKPLLAEAMHGYDYILRFQAMECLCPLNNVRLLPEGNGRFAQCHRQQLATPDECTRCIQERGHLSGSLHQAERALSGVGTPGYHEQLIRALGEAEAVLVVNPLQEAMLSPYAKSVRVVTAGMDPGRFPWPRPQEPDPWPKQKPALFFAGLVDEFMKGYAVLHEACALLWKRRQDFELVVTGDPPGRVDEFTRNVGWLSQAELPRYLRAADICVIPTIAQEALGRTAVEAMAAGRPVVASRLGGLPFTVGDGATGLLCQPGDPAACSRTSGSSSCIAAMSAGTACRASGPILPSVRAAFQRTSGAGSLSSSFTAGTASRASGPNRDKARTAFKRSSVFRTSTSAGTASRAFGAAWPALSTTAKRMDRADQRLDGRRRSNWKSRWSAATAALASLMSPASSCRRSSPSPTPVVLSRSANLPPTAARCTGRIFSSTCSAARLGTRSSNTETSCGASMARRTARRLISTTRAVMFKVGTTIFWLAFVERTNMSGYPFKKAAGDVATTWRSPLSGIPRP